MKKDSMICWCCKKAVMQPCQELGSGWFKCPGCGATWVKMIKQKAMPKIVNKSLSTAYEVSVTARRELPKKARA